MPWGGGIIGSLNSSKGETKNGSTITAQAAATKLVERPAGETFGQFPNGYTYAYTDKTLATNLHAGTGTTDLKSQTVNTSDATKRGTAVNPYVIENTTDWENFAKFTYNNKSYTAGKVFVLARDIDFTGVTFRFIPAFSGSFYGLGHTLSNITINTWQYWNNASVTATNAWANFNTAATAAKDVFTFTGYGLFGLASDASITDLNVEKFKYSNLPKSFPTTAQPWANFVGGLAGNTAGNTFIGNCHLQGSANLAYTAHAWWGGIVGMHTEAAGRGTEAAPKTLLIYRSSADTTSTVKVTYSTTTYNLHDGGIIGDVGENMTALVYDCVSNRDVSNTSYTNQTGGIVGYTRPTSSLTVENVVSFVKFTSLAKDAKGVNNYGVGFGYNNSKLTLKNVYLMSNSGYSNFYTVNSGSTNYTASQVTVGPYVTANLPTGTTKKNTDNAVIDAAKAAVGSTLSNKIWDSTKFTTAGMNTFTPDKTPLRNHLVQIPLNHEVEYTGVALDVTGADWYDEDVHGNTDIMTIDYPSGGLKYAGNHTVNFVLKSGYIWNDGTTGSKQVTVTVTKKEVGLSWDTSGGIAVADFVTSDLVLNDRGTNKPKLTFTYYYDDGEETPLGDGKVPDKIGNYIAKAEINTLGTGRNYKIKESDVKRQFTLTAIPINTPTVSNGEIHQYTGEDIEFTLANDGQMGSDENVDKIVELTQANMPTGATYKKVVDEETGAITRTITVKNVGEYSIPFTLYDQTNNCWGDGGGVLNLEVTQRPLTLSIGRPNGAGWEFETNTNEVFTITHNAVGEDRIRYNITYDKPNNGGTIIVGADKIKTEGNVTTVTLDPLDTGTHVIHVELATPTSTNENGNYLANIIEKEVEVVGKSVTISDADIISLWQYSDGRMSYGMFNDLPANEIDYTGRTFTVSLKEDSLAAKGVQIKEYVEGEVDGTKYGSTGLNAGTYKTRVVLTALNSTYNFKDKSYDITWKIMKVKFDLSDVKWDCEGSKEYTGSPIKVQLENLHPALTATYSGNISQNVTGGGFNTAEVSFKLKNESADKDNYVLPKASDPNSYIYMVNGEHDGSKFPWTLKWQITQGTIDLVWDLDGADGSGAEDFSFIYPILLNGGKYVDYEFYESINGVPASNSTPMGEIISPDKGGAESYFVKAVFSSEAGNNFVFGNGTNPKEFSLKDYRTGVTVTVEKAGGMYSGEAQPIAFTTDRLSQSDFEVTYLDKNGIRLDGAPVNVGEYTARISVKDDKSATHYVINRTVKFEITKFQINAADLKWNYDPQNPFEFTLVKEGDNYVEKLQTVTLDNVPKTLNLVYTNNSFSAAGTYTATVAFGEDIDEDNIDLSNFKNASGEYVMPASVRTCEWTITKHELTKPTSVSGLTYNGGDYNLITLIGLDADWAQYLTVSVKKGTQSISETEVTAAGTYYITCTPIGSLRNSVEWSDGTIVNKSVTVKIDPMYITIVGWEDKPARPVFQKGEEVDMDYYNVVYQTKDSDGNYTTLDSDANGNITFPFSTDIYASVEVSELMEGNLYFLYDEAAEMLYKFRMFQGQAKQLDRPTLIRPVLEYNFEEQEFYIEKWNEIRDYVTVLGTTSSYNPLVVGDKFIGKRTVRIALRSDQPVVWKVRDNDPNTQFEIVELTIEVVPITLSQDWDEVDENGRPILSFDDLDLDFDISKYVEYEYFNMDGTPIKKVSQMKEGVEYKAIASIKKDYADFFCFGIESEEEGGSTLISRSDEYKFPYGIVEGPNTDPGPTQTDPDKNGEGDNPGTGTLNLPLWQLIVGGASAIFFVFCTLKAFGEYGKLKAAKKEGKELAAQSDITTYGFAPLGLLAMAAGSTFLGLEETPWTIIALVALGLFLISAVALFMLSKKRKAAELVVKREQARIAEEKEYARDEERREEQARRDNEMKMMFAAMQQGGYGQPMQYDDMRSMLAETMQALLPAAMQQMQALPPAQSDPNAYAQPQQGYGSMPNNEVNELRTMMAQQQAQMAQQQELLNQLLQNQTQ